jgi:hypothetical protein
MLIGFPEGPALLDTGSPFDIGRGRAFTLLGAERRPPHLRREVLDVASAQLGVHVEWLVGTPTLSHCCLVLDLPNGRAVFRDDSVAVDGAARLSVNLEAGVPFIKITTARGRECENAVLDSGAPLSYVPRDELADMKPYRVADDFHPSAGEYRTPVYRVPVVIAGRALELDAGILPPELKEAFGDVWIIGGDYFAGRVITLDYPSGRILDAARFPPEITR